MANNPVNPQPNTYHSTAVNPFARAIQEIGGTTANNVAALPGQMLGDAMNSIFGTGNSNPTNNPDNDFAKALEKQNSPEKLNEFEMEKRRAVNHKEMQMNEVFNLRAAKDEQIIHQLQEQLRALAKEVKTLNTSVTTAIHEDVVAPGTYHVHFFQQLLNFVILMRKRVQEANTWIENFNSRHKKQGYFWAQVNSKTGGQAYMNSEEHKISRSVG